jgi:hypothetical protein
VGVPFGAEQLERLAEYEVTVANGLWAWPFEHGVVVCDRPHTMRMEDPRQDGRWQLHCEDGPAMAFGDGYAIHAVHGVRVPGWMIEHPDRLTAAHITKEPNAEIRRIMLTRFGEARYLDAIGATPLDASDFGTLYQVPLTDDEPLTLVKVINATPEPDGSFKPYFLRVQPECRPMLADQTFGDAQELTALNAVASTFGLTGGEYLIGAAS